MKPMSPLAWKLRQIWLKIRCHLRSGRPLIYNLRPGVRFVVHLDDVNSQDIHIKKSYESTELDWCASWLSDGDVFIDCGANIGYYSAYLSQLRKLERVLAIEGNETCADRCEIAFELLGLERVELVRAILHSDESKALHIPDLPGQEGLQHLEKAPDGEARMTTATLDNLTDSRKISPALVKIDCEGAETEILRGAKKLLSEARPAWLIEVNDEALQKVGTHRRELFALLNESGHRLFHVASAFADHPFGIEIDEDFPSWSFNMAAIPDDQATMHRWENTLLK